MMKKLSLILLVFVLALVSCEDEDFTTYSGEVLFGNFAGHCLGNCFTAFRLDDVNLESDDNDGHFSFENYQFSHSRTLNETAFNEAKNIFQSFPSEFINGGKDRYGCPDCADQGGYFIIFYVADEKKMVILDTEDTDDQSAEILAFKEKLQALIQEHRN